MRLDTFWIRLIGAIDVFSVWPPSNNEVSQEVLSKTLNSTGAIEADPPHIIIGQAFDDGKAYAAADGSPVISPPQNGQEKGDRMNCTYPEMNGWQSCHTPERRNCWLQNIKENRTMDINTNYEIPLQVPNGTTRKVCLYDI